MMRIDFNCMQIDAAPVDMIEINSLSIVWCVFVFRLVELAG